jgi:hypothetical protein
MFSVKNDKGAMVQFVANPARMPASITALLNTGNTPGCPGQIWQMFY